MKQIKQIKSMDTFDLRGIPVVNIRVPYPTSFFAIYTLAGSMYETAADEGLAHFSEHMMFKGTATRNWHDINYTFAQHGARNNAYTSNEDVVYFASFMQDHAAPIIELMMDLFFNSTFPAQEITKERNVVMEERRSAYDDPSYEFMLNTSEAFFGRAVGHNAFGSEEQIKAFSRAGVERYLKGLLDKSNIMLLYVGDMPSADLRKNIEWHMPAKHKYLIDGASNANVDFPAWSDDNDDYHLASTRIKQSQVVAMLPCLSANDPRYRAALMGIAALGSGSHSLLYETMREKMGLCYNVYAQCFSIYYPNETAVRIASFLDKSNIDKFKVTAEKLVAKVCKDGLDKTLFTCAKNMAIFNRFNAMSDPQSLGLTVAQKIFHNRDYDIDKESAAIIDVTVDDCNDVLRDIFLNKPMRWAIMEPK